MSSKDEKRERLIAKYRPFIATAGGGIFTRKTRERLVGILDMRGRAGRYGLEKNRKSENSFWYDRRNEVRNALKDLLLFIETADKGQIDQVLTREPLDSIIGSLLLGEAVFNIPPDQNRAEIADMLIRQSFNYLEMKAGDHINLSNKRTMHEAVDLSKFLLQSIRGERYSRPSIGLEKE